MKGVASVAEVGSGSLSRWRERVGVRVGCSRLIPTLTLALSQREREPESIFQREREPDSISQRESGPDSLSIEERG
jgi:hypothetical protein